MLIRHVLPPMVTIGNCTTNQAEGCGRLGLSPQVLRLAAFASDISEARTEEDLRASMERFLDQSSDVAIKRTGPPARRVFLNGYVTGSAELPVGDQPGDWDRRRLSLQIPIGLEVVWRRDTGRPDRTHSLFVRLVELGGFLPNETQGDGRSTDEVIASLVRPGAFYAFGFSKGVPVTVGVGMTTSLTRAPERPEGEDAPSWEWKPRVSMFIGWDIPIFP